MKSESIQTRLGRQDTTPSGFQRTPQYRHDVLKTKQNKIQEHDMILSRAWIGMLNVLHADVSERVKDGVSKMVDQTVSKLVNTGATIALVFKRQRLKNLSF